jgi:predicted nuclease of predicted toxin-antitoxin system
VKFLVDARLPVRLALLLNNAGHEAVHTGDLPGGNPSTDAQVVGIAEAQDRVVVTKYRDFRDGHLLKGSPRKLPARRRQRITRSAAWPRRIRP